MVVLCSGYNKGLMQDHDVMYMAKLKIQCTSGWVHSYILSGKYGLQHSNWSICKFLAGTIQTSPHYLSLFFFPRYYYPLNFFSKSEFRLYKHGWFMIDMCCLPCKRLCWANFRFGSRFSHNVKELMFCFIYNQ